MIRMPKSPEHHREYPCLKSYYLNFALPSNEVVRSYSSVLALRPGASTNTTGHSQLAIRWHERSLPKLG